MSIPISHLGSLNPHVAAAMNSQQAGAAAGWHLPRQAAGRPVTAFLPFRGAGSSRQGGERGGGGEGMLLPLTGVSAFAFQGTNAHVVLSPPGKEVGEVASP